jgi:hypothetical protein
LNGVKTIYCTACQAAVSPPANPEAVVVVCGECAHAMFHHRGQVRDLTREEAKQLEQSPAFIALRNRQVSILETRGWKINY